MNCNDSIKLVEKLNISNDIISSWESGVVNVYFSEDSDKKIGKYVFYECYALQSIYLGETRYRP